MKTWRAIHYLFYEISHGFRNTRINFQIIIKNMAKNNILVVAPNLNICGIFGKQILFQNID